MIKKGEYVTSLPVVKGMKLTVPVTAAEDLAMPLSNAEIEMIETRMELPRDYLNDVINIWAKIVTSGQL